MRISLTLAFIVSLAGCTCVDTVMTQTNTREGGRGDGGLVVASDGGPIIFDGPRDAGLRDGGPSPLEVVSIEVEPALVALTPPVGQRMSQIFTAKLVRRDGSKVAASSVTWSQDTLVAGDVEPNTGSFTTNGVSGALVKISATVIERGAPMVGTAQVQVTVQSVTFASGTPSDVPTKFRTLEAPGAASAEIKYPLDNVVMPQNVFAADVQWQRGEPGDVFRVTLSKSNVNVTAYLTHTGVGFNNHWLVETSAWRALAQTSTDEAATLRVDRWVAATSTTVASNPVRLKFAKAALSGSIYFWGINEGRIFRIDDGTNSKVNFMPKPPVMNEGGGNTSQCVGCHSISPSGRYMAGRMGGGVNYGTVFDLTNDLTGDPPPSLFPTNQTQWWFSTWNPAETRMIVSTSWPPPTKLMLLNPHTGQEVTANGAGLPASNEAHPAWSPDGTMVAYTHMTSPEIDWGVDYRESDLNVLPVTGPDTFGTPVTLIRGRDVPGIGAEQRALSYPGWTPDSKRLVFSMGYSARSSPPSNTSPPHPGKLYMANKDGTNIVPLTKANNADDASYEPRFSPFDSGGYYWLAFLSRRDYGNATNGSAGSRVAQIWITAIKKNPAPGEDPSEVGYWMTGQNPKSASISAYWAPRACRATGIACGVGSECCSGDCRPPATGGPSVCSPPPPDRCRIDGQTCGGGGECCAGLTCEQSVCRVPIL